MKLLTYLLYTLLALHFMGCKDKPKNKREFIKERIEMRDSLKTLHPDSIVKYRGKNKKDCCKACVCKDTINN